MRRSTRVSEFVMVTDPCTYHGEGAIWDPAARAVRWVDMLAGDVLTLDPATSSVSRLHVGNVAAAIRPRVTGGLVVAVERGFALLDAGSNTPRFLGELWSDTTIRMNDGGCDHQGRFYCGSMAYGAALGRGTLFRLDPDGTVSTVLQGVTISNGLAWSPDGSTVYYIDSATQRVDAFDFDRDRGTLTDRRSLVRIAEEDGAPDGMTVDADGFLWVAMWGGSSVRRYAPNGRLDATLTLPALQATSCSFGGPALDELYVTTSRVGLTRDQDPWAGALFRSRPGIRGVPPNRFAG